MRLAPDHQTFLAGVAVDEKAPPNSLPPCLFRRYLHYQIRRVRRIRRSDYPWTTDWADDSYIHHVSRGYSTAPHRIPRVECVDSNDSGRAWSCGLGIRIGIPAKQHLRYCTQVGVCTRPGCAYTTLASPIRSVGHMAVPRTAPRRRLSRT